MTRCYPWIDPTDATISRWLAGFGLRLCVQCAKGPNHSLVGHGPINGCANARCRCTEW